MDQVSGDMSSYFSHDPLVCPAGQPPTEASNVVETAFKERVVNDWLRVIFESHVKECGREDKLLTMLDQWHDKECPDKPPPDEMICNQRDICSGVEWHQWQTRYLRLLCIVNEVERWGAHGLRSIHAGNWLDGADRLLAAITSLDALVRTRDDWWAARYSCHENAATQIADGHEPQVLDMLRENLDILCTDTTRAHATAVQRIETRMEQVDSQLEPLLRARDKARAQMGEVRWKANRNPTNRYTENRSVLQAESKDLNNALGMLSGLSPVTM